MVGSGIRIFTGETRGVGSQGADRRVVYMVNGCECCARKGCKVQRTVDGEKAIIIGIEW